MRPIQSANRFVEPRHPVTSDCSIMRVCVVSALVLFAVGCGGSDRPDLVPVNGTVLLDGEPVAGAAVAFQLITDEKASYKRPSSAMTDAQGNFALQTYIPGDGAPLGNYKVTITKRDVVGELPANYNAENPEATPIKYQWVVPREYSEADTSGLQAEVTTAGLDPSVFDLTSGGAKPKIEVIGGRKRNEP